MGSTDQSQAIWYKLAQVAVGGAEYDSSEREPHPKCLKGTRVNLLSHMYGSLDDSEESSLVWLSGTAGVGKSAIAFTIAEKMRGLRVTAEAPGETRLAGTFFFSRKYTNRCTTGYFFATLAYQLATTFSSIRCHIVSTIDDRPTLLQPRSSLRDQMEHLFLGPLRRLKFRLTNCPPLVFVIDALDECSSEDEAAKLIFLLGQALHDQDLPVIHILLTSRPEAHIHEAMDEEVCDLVRKIPMQTSGDRVTPPISLDGVDVDSDIYIFLKHSFTQLRRRNPLLPQPTEDELQRLADRAGRRFIVASTMMKFVNDGYNDPRDRLELMLKLTSQLLQGTEVNKFYDYILSTCTDPERAYMHLSVVAALTNPLPVSQIAELLGPGQGRDVETVLVQLRSVMDIPTDTSLPVKIYHSSVRDYALDFSNCSFFGKQRTTPSPHSLLADSSFRLMIRDLPKSTGLLDAFLRLKSLSKVMEPHPSQSLRDSLAFTVERPTALGVFTALLWLRGDCSQRLYYWLETLDGRAWLHSQGGTDWLESKSGAEWIHTDAGMDWLGTQDGKEWLETPRGREWLETPSGREWLETSSAQEWLQTQSGQEWLQSASAREWLQNWSGQLWLLTLSGREWLETPSGREWLQTPGALEWLQTPSVREWLQTPSAREWLESWHGRQWLETPNGLEWLETPSGREWLEAPSGQEWLRTPSGREWLETLSGQEWLEISSVREWLKTLRGQESLQTPSLQELLQTPSVQEWLQTPSGHKWLQSESARKWLQSWSGRLWLETQSGQEWLQSPDGKEWLQMLNLQDWLQTPSGWEWLQTPSGWEWLQTPSGRKWLQSPSAPEWLRTTSAQKWPQTPCGQEWLQNLSGRRWLWTSSAREWLEIPSGREWLQTPSGREWLQTLSARGWLQTPSGREWLQTLSAREWLLTPSGEEWLQSESCQEWLQSWNGQLWLLTLSGQEWLQTLSGQEWL